MLSRAMMAMVSVVMKFLFGIVHVLMEILTIRSVKAFQFPFAFEQTLKHLKSNDYQCFDFT